MVKKILIVIAIVIVALFLTKDLLVKSVLTAGISSFTDLAVGIKGLNVGIFKSAVEMKGFKLYNPRSFKDRIMMDMPELYVDYDLGSIFTGTKHIKVLKLYLEKFVVIKNEAGQLNLDSLKAIQAPAGGKAARAKEAGIRIDVMELKVGKVIYIDYSKGGAPVVKEYDVGLNERYENITNPYALASLIVFKSLVNTRISSLANLDLGPLKDTTSDAVAKAAGTAAQTLEKATEAVKKLFPLGK